MGRTYVDPDDQMNGKLKKRFQDLDDKFSKEIGTLRDADLHLDSDLKKVRYGGMFLGCLILIDTVIHIIQMFGS